MKPTRYFLRSFAAATSLLWNSALGLADSQVDAVVEQLRQRSVDKAMHTTEGEVQFLTPEMCAGQESCLGNNPGSPYGAVFFSLAHGQPVAPAVNSSIPLDVPGMLPYTQLRVDEAIVLVGRMPEGSKYFGITPNLFSRTYGKSEEQRVVFAASGDSINRLTIKQDAGLFAVIVTASSNQQQQVTASLIESGMPPHAIQTLVMADRDPFRLGWQPDADQLGVLIRLGRVIDQESVDQYVRQPPISALRLTPKVEVNQMKLAATPLRKIGTGICEGRVPRGSSCFKSIDTALDATLESVAKEIRNRELLLIPDRGELLHGPLAPSDPSVTENSTAGLSTCVRFGTNCMGDNRDTIYSLDAVGTLSDDARDEIVIVGVNHVATNKTTYFSHSIYDVRSQTGIGSIGDGSVEIGGVKSIEYFLGRRIKNATEGRLYALKISRSCGSNPFCLQIPSSGPLSLAPGSLFQLTSRYYLEPATKVKPSEDEIVAPRVIRLFPK